MEMCVTNKNLLRVMHGVPSPNMLSSARTDLIISALQQIDALCLLIKNRGMLVVPFIVQTIRMLFMGI